MTAEDRAEVEALTATIRTGLGELVSTQRALCELLGLVVAQLAEQSAAGRRTVELLEAQVAAMEASLGGVN